MDTYGEMGPIFTCFLLFIFRFIFDPPAKSARITAHGRLFETCAYLFKMLLGWALIRDVRLFETCAKSSIYGIINDLFRVVMLMTRLPLQIK